jgi:nucleotide-binding universal stress UspA family protein
MGDTLEAATDHLRRFRATFNAGDSVAEESCLAADDLDAILVVVRSPSDLVAGGSLSMDEVGGRA